MDIEKLLPLIGVVATASGYVALNRGNATRFRASTLSWEQRLFEAGLFGGLIFATSRGFAVWVCQASPQFVHQSVFNYFKQALPFPFSGSLAISIALGVTLGPIQNLLITPLRALTWATEHFGTVQQITLFRAALNHKLLLFEFRREKIIVGQVSELSPFDRRPAYVRLLPLITGFRDQDGRVHFRELPAELIDQMVASGAPKETLDNLSVLLDGESIESVVEWDPESHIKLMKQSQ